MLEARIAAYVLEPFTNACINTSAFAHCPHPGVELMLINDTLTWLGFRTRITLYNGLTHAQDAVETGREDVMSVLQPAAQAWGKDAKLKATPVLLSERPVFFIQKPHNDLGNNLFSSSDYYIW